MRNLSIDGFLGGFKECIEAAKYNHRENYIAILTAHKNVAQNIICDVPYERYSLTVNDIHYLIISFSEI